MTRDVTDLLSKALILLAEKFAGLLDRSGRPSVLHPLRVALSSNDPDAQIVGLLHDLVEDTDLTLEDLTTYGFPNHIVAAVDLVSRQEHQSYREFIRRIISSKNKLAVRVKLNDLADNIARLSELPDKGEARGLLKRYRQAQMDLEQVWDYDK